MEIKDLNLGQILVSAIPTKAGIYHRFWKVTEKTQRTASVQPLKIKVLKSTGICTMVAPSDEVEDFHFKVGKDCGGLFIGDNVNKKTLQKTYMTLSSEETSYISTFDPSKLI